MTGQIENVTSAKRKRMDYIPDDDFDIEPARTKKPKMEPVFNKDSVNTANTTTTPDLEKPGALSYSTLVDMSKKVYNFFVTPLSLNNSAPAGGKGATEGVKGIGAPTLEPSNQINKEEIYKLLEEMKPLLQRIKETLNEAEDDIKKEEEFKKFERLLGQVIVEYLKRQKVIREDAAMNLKFEVVFDQQRDRALRKDKNDIEGQRIEANKDLKYWSKINTGLTCAVMAVAAASIAAAAITATSGAALPAAIKMTFGVTQIILTTANGGSMLIKAKLDSQHRELQGKTDIMKHKHSELNWRIRDEMGQMKGNLDQAYKVIGWMKQIVDNEHRTSQAISSR